MKKYLILLFTVLTSLHVSAQSDGSQLWLGKQYANSCQVISQLCFLLHTVKNKTDSGEKESMPVR